MKFLKCLGWIFNRNSNKSGIAEAFVNQPEDTSILIKNADRFYNRIFSKVEAASDAPLDPNTISAIVGFAAGGPVSLRSIEHKRIYLTCELAMYESQQASSDGALRYEFITDGHFSEDTARTIMTVLGRLSQSAVLGKGHTVDVKAALESAVPFIVRLEQFSKFSFGKNSFGIYRVVPAS